MLEEMDAESGRIAQADPSAVALGQASDAGGEVNHEWFRIRNAGWIWVSLWRKEAW